MGHCIVRLFLFAFLTLSLAEPAWAYRWESRIPLMGCRGHYAASGSARYIRIRGENKTSSEQLVIEIRNVPLPPGTILVVYVEDEAIGTIRLNEKQAGQLILESSFRKFIPPIDAGTNVVVKTVQGRDVMW
jgi:hypothetical protein